MRLWPRVESPNIHSPAIKCPNRSRDGQLTNLTKPGTDQMCPKFVLGNFTSPTQGKFFMCLVPSFIAPHSQNSLELHLELCDWQWVVICPNKKMNPT